jgi:hypothetical protein
MMWAAPAEWCPAPRHAIILRVKGNSRSSLIIDRTIVAVGSSEVSRDNLRGEIAVAWTAQGKRLLVSRLVGFIVDPMVAPLGDVVIAIIATADLPVFGRSHSVWRPKFCSANAR